jgi:hypothetical protein
MKRVVKLAPWLLAPLLGGAAMLTFLLLYDRGGESSEPPGAVGEQALPGTPVAPEKLQEARDFKEFPLWWLGESFDSLNLRIHWATPERGSPTMNSVYLIYGQCVIEPGHESCGPPLSILVEPLCSTPPEKVVGLANGPPFAFRGAGALWVDDHLRIWTDDSAIAIWAHPRDRILKAAEAIVPLGNIDVPLGGSGLPPPNFDKCPPYVEPTIVPFPPDPTPATPTPAVEGGDGQ